MVRNPDSDESNQRARDAAFEQFRRATEGFARRAAETVFGGNVTKNGHDPQEAVDFAYEQFYRKSFDQALAEEDRRPRLLQMVTRRAIDFVKHGKPADDLRENDRDGRLGASDPGFEQVEDQDEAAHLVRQVEPVLDRLKPDQLDVFKRRIIGGETTQQIAEALGVTQRRVNQILGDVTKRLRRRVGVDEGQQTPQDAMGDDDSKECVQ